MHDAVKISVFCDSLSSFVNKLRQFGPLQANVPSVITKLYEFHDALQIARRRFIKQGSSAVPSPASPTPMVVEPSVRKVSCYYWVLAVPLTKLFFSLRSARFRSLLLPLTLMSTLPISKSLIRMLIWICRYAFYF
jgi:hypothetical protein